MDARVRTLPHLNEDDLALLERIEAGMPITADVARADLLLCVLLESGRVLIARHALPESISSLYKEEATGRTVAEEDQPLVLRALQGGSGGRRQREVLRNGAPVIEDVFPVCTPEGKTIAAFVVETTMIAHERQRRRDRRFQQAAAFIIEGCVRGELASAACLSRFGLYDGIYLVDRSRTVLYMSGIAANMFRTIGVPASLHSQPLAMLEQTDIDLVDQLFAGEECAEIRTETDDGRTWVRRAVPLRVPVTIWQNRWFTQPVGHLLGLTTERRIDQVLVLLHNATEAVEKQRELNVKAALIQEVHHRVKNNLQNIAAILRLQARRSGDETRQHLTDAVNRVLSMSVIHEYLSQSDSRSINIKDVCTRIAAQVQEVSRNPEQEVEVRVQGPNIRLPASQATPAALVINELLLNALEHGVKDRAQGIIEVALNDLGDAVQLAISDDGTGLPPDFDLQASQSLGLQIVHTLVTDDLKGSVTFSPADSTGKADGAGRANGDPPTGTVATVVFPKRPLHGD